MRQITPGSSTTQHGYLAIRGREQQLIDYHGAPVAKALGLNADGGGAKSDTRPGTPLTENNIRAVAKESPFGQIFHEASNLFFGGEIAKYTGYKRF